MNQDQNQDQGPTLGSLLGPSCTVFGLGLSAAGVFFTEQRTGLMMFGLLLVLFGLLIDFAQKFAKGPVPPIDAPALRDRWKAGFLVLLVCWLLVMPLFDIFGKLIDLLHPGEADSSGRLLALKWGAFMILVPLIISLMREGQALARFWAFWLNGFRVLLIGCLVVLPSVLLNQAIQLVKQFGGIEKYSQGDVGLYLLALVLNVVLVPFWVLPLFRRIARSSLADQLASFWEESDTRKSGLEDRAGT